MAALAGLSHWLESQGSGILGNFLEPIRTRLETILRDRGINPDPWRERIRLLPMAARAIAPGLLPPVAKAAPEGVEVEAVELLDGAPRELQAGEFAR